MDSQTKTNYFALLIFLAAFSLYLFTMVPSLTGDDSGELAGVGVTLGTAHPPGYPVYSLSGKIAVAAVPWGNFAYRVNLVSAVFMALSAAIIFLIISGIQSSIFISAVSSLMFSFSALVWSMSNVTEVYGVAAFSCCLICLVMSKQPSYRNFLLVCFLCGFGMSAHYTIGLIVPGIAWWAIENRGFIFKQRPLAALLSGLLFVLAGFSTVLFIYVRANQNPIFGWEDPKTIDRFYQVAARLRYGSFALMQGGAPKISLDIITQKIFFYLTSLSDNFTIIGLIVFGAGLIFCAANSSFGRALIIMLLGSGPGFLLLANAGLDNSSKALLQRFFFLSIIFAAVIMGKGLSRIDKMLNLRAVYAIIAVPVFLVLNNFPEQNRRQEFLFNDYARNLFRSAPFGSIIFSDRADEMEFSMAYLRYAQHIRNDIDIIDCNAGITRSIYGDDYYRIWGKKRLAIREKTESEIISRSSRPVYYATFYPEMINIPRYQEGLIFGTANKKKRGFRFDEIYAIRYPEQQDGLDERGANLLSSHFQLMGEYFLNEDDARTAQKYFDGLIAYDRTKKQISSVAFLYHKKGMLDFAEKYYTRAISLGVKDAGICTNLGAIYENRGIADLAEKFYLQALALEPGNAQAHYNLAVLYWRQAKWGKVIDELQIVTGLDPSNTTAKYYLDTARKRIKD